MEQRWQKPEEGYHKCNVDVAVFAAKLSMRTEFVIRDHEGFVARCGCLTSKGLYSSKIVEALALRWVVPKQLLGLGCTNIILELDATTCLVDDKIEYSSIVKDCQPMLAFANNFKIVSVKIKEL